MNEVLTLVLSHQTAPALAPVLEVWKQVAGTENLLLAYGGTRSNFDAISFEQKLYVDDPALRTRDHQREKQSYTGMLRQAAEWMRARPQFGYIHFVEYDHIPLVRDLYARFLERMNTEDADVLAFHLRRIDGTSDAHYLHHAYDPRFHEFFAKISRRDDRAVVLAMLGTGSFWKREAFEAVTACAESFPTYFELYLPSLAHHLGYRLRDMGEQNRSAWNLGDYAGSLGKLRASGAWTAHPVKDIRAASDVLAP